MRIRLHAPRKSSPTIFSTHPSLSVMIVLYPEVPREGWRRPWVGVETLHSKKAKLVRGP